MCLILCTYGFIYTLKLDSCTTRQAPLEKNSEILVFLNRHPESGIASLWELLYLQDIEFDKEKIL